jgi:hypothetical protein
LCVCLFVCLFVCLRLKDKGWVGHVVSMASLNSYKLLFSLRERDLMRDLSNDVSMVKISYVTLIINDISYLSCIHLLR